jgi:hypothetical protein
MSAGDKTICWYEIMFIRYSSGSKRKNKRVNQKKLLTNMEFGKDFFIAHFHHVIDLFPGIPELADDFIDSRSAIKRKIIYFE